MSCNYDSDNWQGCAIGNNTIVNVADAQGMVSPQTAHAHIFKGQQYSCSGTGSAFFIPYI